MEKNSSIYIAGHRGLLGSSLLRVLKESGFNNLILREKAELDLRHQKATRTFFDRERPEYVFLTAAKVGGLQANNTYRADFIYDNIQIQTNVIDSAFRFNTKKLLFVSSNCMYPKECSQPMKEEDLLTGILEITNQSFAVAKVAGVEMCQAYNFQHNTNFISVIPASLYGPGDNYTLGESHIVPTLIRGCHEAKNKGLEKVILPGSGKRQRELIYVDDAARACLFLINNYDFSEPINIGFGKDYTLEEIAEKVKKLVGFEGRIEFDNSKPSGMMKKMLDSSKIENLGWKPKTNFEEGLKIAYGWFLKNITSAE